MPCVQILVLYYGALYEGWRKAWLKNQIKIVKYIWCVYNINICCELCEMDHGFINYTMKKNMLSNSVVKYFLKEKSTVKNVQFSNWLQPELKHNGTWMRVCGKS